MRIPVLGVGFDNVTMEQAVAEGVRLMNTEGAHYVVTPNPEIVETCQADSEAMEAVGRADLVIADGIGVVYGARILGTPLKDLKLKNGVLIAGIVRGDQVIIPEGSSCLQVDDIVIVIAKDSGILDLNDIYADAFGLRGGL